MDDKLIESNCLRLPENAAQRRRRINKSCLNKQPHKSSPKSAKTLPFHYFTERHRKDAETPPPSSLDINRIHDHRPDLIRWHLHNGHPRHHQHQQYHQQLNANGNSTTTTQKYFSKKFSFTQHSNHLSRFYMIFIVFLIYLLDKINCDQGEYGILAATMNFFIPQNTQQFRVACVHSAYILIGMPNSNSTDVAHTPPIAHTSCKHFEMCSILQ